MRVETAPQEASEAKGGEAVNEITGILQIVRDPLIVWRDEGNGQSTKPQAQKKTHPKIYFSFSANRRRARKDARKARTSFPGQLLTKGAPGRRNGRQRAVDQTQGCWTADGRPYPVAWFESRQSARQAEQRKKAGIS